MASARPEQFVEQPSGSRYRVGVLLYCRGGDGRLLLIKRNARPNAGLWCAVGGKLEMATGESPFECVRREAREELGLELADSDLKLRAILSEKDYEGTGHWLMFVFEASKPVEQLPEPIDEGEFGLFAESELDGLAMPVMDRRILQERILVSGETLHVLKVAAGAERFPDHAEEEERIG